ncbi:MAG: hypothetical protein RLY71_245 [Pseudomonadota bacterium]|jgi:zinc/manganese transport system ATP-binding protein
MKRLFFWRQTGAIAPSQSSAPAADAPPGALRLTDLSLAYQGREVVSGVSGSFAPGQLTAIIGPNGAGKSSLLAAIMGRLSPSAGRIDLPPALRAHLAWLPQQAQIERSVPMRVADVVALGLWRELGPFGGLRTDQQQRVQAALDAVGLGAQAERPVAALSAGQFQRMLFARVLVQDARLVLLDEPFNAVDEDTAADLMVIVRRWRDEGRTVIAVLHDLALVRAAFDETLWLNRRCLAWGPTAEVLQVRPAVPEPALADLVGELPAGWPGVRPEVLPPGWHSRPADRPVLAT